MSTTTNFFYGTGRRKTSIARVRLLAGMDGKRVEAHARDSSISAHSWEGARFLISPRPRARQATCGAGSSGAVSSTGRVVAPSTHTPDV